MSRMSSICLGVFLRVVDTVTFVFVVVVDGAAALAAALVDFLPYGLLCFLALL